MITIAAGDHRHPLGLPRHPAAPMHAIAPKTYGPAGGYDIYSGHGGRGPLRLRLHRGGHARVATAGSVDLSEGMFRHLVVTGRSRPALYLARIPAGLAIIVPLVAAGFTIVCAVCVFAAPTQHPYGGVNVPTNFTRAGLRELGGPPPRQRPLRFPTRSDLPPSIGPPRGFNSLSLQSGPNGPPRGPRSAGRPIGPAHRACGRGHRPVWTTPTTPTFLYPSDSFMIKSGLWLELEAAIGFLVALGLSSLLGAENGGRRPHDRARDHPDPDLLPGPDPPSSEPPAVGGGGGHGPLDAGRAVGPRGRRGWPRGRLGNPRLIPESTTVAVIRDRGLAGGLDRSGGMADDDPRHLTTAPPLRVGSGSSPMVGGAGPAHTGAVDRDRW